MSMAPRISQSDRRPHRLLAAGWATLLIIAAGCGESRPAVAPNPLVPTAAGENDDSGIAVSAVDDVVTSTESAADEAMLAREEIDLFAFSTLQIQRVTLLQDGRIQNELDLTDEQIALFKQLGQEVERMRDTLQTLPPDERREKLLNEYRPKADEYRLLVEQTLDESQQQTLFQRVLQRQRGAIIFLFPGVSEALALTDAQRDSLYDIIDETRNSVDFNQLSNPIELGRILMKANAARKKAEEQLTAEQRAAWNKLLGK